MAPSIIDDLLIVGATTNAGRVSITVQGDTVESTDMNLDRVVGITQCTGRAMTSIHRKEWDAMLARIHDLWLKSQLRSIGRRMARSQEIVPSSKHLPQSLVQQLPQSGAPRMRSTCWWHSRIVVCLESRVWRLWTVEVPSLFEHLKHRVPELSYRRQLVVIYTGGRTGFWPTD